MNAFDFSTRLGPAERAGNLDRLEQQRFDVAIIGAGVTGAGCALDAASRGLAVALIEQRDLASGTSSRSSKLIHGGLRYLEQLNFGLVREALRERGLLFEKLAPHLIEPVSFLYPLQHRMWERAYVGSGVLLYDALARLGGNPLPGHRHLSKKGVMDKFPGLKSEALVGGILYWDAQVDDSRHTMAVARTAAGYGAVVVTSMRAVGLEKTDGRVSEVEAVCLETGRAVSIRAGAFINATGVWTDHVQDLAGGGQIHVTASKGIHLVVPLDRVPSHTGMIIRTPTSVLFLVPWGDFWIIGTTDTKWNLDLAHPAASRTDIDYLLEQVNTVLASPLTHEDVVGVFAGLRPLLSGESDSTSKLSREHAVSEPVPGLITIAGGKYTTYRVMAADAVDAAIAGRKSRPPSRTEAVPLLGADGYTAMWDRRHALAAEAGLDTEVVEHLLRRYGSETAELLDLVRRQPDLARPLEGAPGYLRVEVVWAVTHEAALHLDDVLTRRTHISIETRHRGVASAPEVAELMAAELDWDDATVTRELEHYRSRVEAELESQTMMDDATADAARLGAPDVRTGKRT